jgi:L-ascorbate metabolism protein UlaG (beta-lactamase superfamily)
MIPHADMILAAHAHPGHLDAGTLLPMPKRLAARESGNAGQARGTRRTRRELPAVALRLPIAGWASSTSGRICTRWTIYYAGDRLAYLYLAARLRPFRVNVALLRIGGKNF